MTTEDFKDFISERFKNPFLASLAFFWLAFNWRIPYLLFFSEDSVSKIFGKIDSDYSSILDNYVFPLFTAIIYVLLKDHIFEFIEKKTSKAHLKRKSTLSKRIIEEIDLKVDEVQAQNRLDEAKMKNKDKEELQEKINELSEQIESYKIRLQESNEVLKFSQNETNEFRSLKNEFGDIANLDAQISDFSKKTSYGKVMEFGELVYTYANWNELGSSKEYPYEVLVNELEINNLIKFNLHKKIIHISNIGLFCLFNYLFSPKIGTSIKKES